MVEKHGMDKPESSRGDTAHMLVKAALSTVPLAGGAAAELFAALIVPPIAKRRDEWIQSIADGLRALEEKASGFSIESLQNNEAFVTTTMHATQVAIRNHQQEKREALRNAVLNVASGNAPDDDLQLMFLNFIDTLTPWHLRLLSFFRDPSGYGKAKSINYPGWSMGAPSTVIEHTFEAMRGRRDFYEQIVRDLFSRGLLTSGTDALHTTMTAGGMFAKRTTELGDRFLAFISSPLQSAS